MNNWGIRMKTNLIKKLLILSLMMFAGSALAAVSTIGGMASMITSSFAQITNLITGASYLAGLGFSIGAIMKFKAHKDNPTQITVGTPIALVFIAAALLFLPSLLDVAGGTMFGGGSTSGPSGAVYTSS
ncbi:MAG: type IV secretion protein IcmD [Gammaproteobacteria bacterium]|nr:type IV secretion protein IcmD [Gammaproteobacteria bacterium]MCH9715645.1 type IV secretion protein IcmD [Gammaproteobacteria bacterium]MCH9763440.1 type IV secretion protein IcmD [Gammaproteobacteria bacterium]